MQNDDRSLFGGISNYMANRFGSFTFHDRALAHRRGSIDSNFSPGVAHVTSNTALTQAHRRRRQGSVEYCKYCIIKQ